VYTDFEGDMDLAMFQRPLAVLEPKKETNLKLRYLTMHYGPLQVVVIQLCN